MIHPAKTKPEQNHGRAGSLGISIGGLGEGKRHMACPDTNISWRNKGLNR